MGIKSTESVGHDFLQRVAKQLFICSAATMETWFLFADEWITSQEGKKLQWSHLGTTQPSAKTEEYLKHIFKQALPFAQLNIVPSEWLCPTAKYGVTALVILSPFSHTVKLKLHLDKCTQNQKFPELHHKILSLLLDKVSLSLFYLFVFFVNEDIFSCM